MPLPQRTQRAYNYADYQRFDPKQRWELLDGVAVCMSPSPTPRHQAVVTELSRQIANQLLGKRCQVFVAPLDVLLPWDDEPDEEVTTVVQPDVLVVCDPKKIGPKHLRGAPDFVVEVLSPSTAGHDQISKRRKYQQAGVRELWFVHPTDRLVFVNRLVDGVLVPAEPQELTESTPVGILDEVAIQWAEVVERLTAEA